MKKYLKVEILALTVIILLSFLLRFHNYGNFPVVGETRDEYAWAFLGSSLIQTGTPVSWSYFEAYTPFDYFLLGANEYPMVRPALDHPPLFALIPGIMHSLRSPWSDFASITVIRFPMVLIGTLNVLLVYFVGKKLFSDTLTPLLATAIYGIGPLFVFSSRLVVAENALVTLFLVSSLVLFSDLKNRAKYLVLAILCITAIMTKMTGLVLPSALGLYALLNKDRKLVITSIIGGVLGILIFCLYGMIFDWQLFLNILTSQSGRTLGLAAFHNRYFLHPNIVFKIFIDGWMMTGIISTFIYLYLQKTKRESYLAIVIVLNFLFILVTAGEANINAWYNYVLFPFFALTTASVFKKIFDEKNSYVFILYWFLLVASIKVMNSHMLVHYSSNLIRLAFGLGFFPILFEVLPTTKKYTKHVWLVYWELFCYQIYSAFCISIIDHIGKMMNTFYQGQLLNNRK